MPENSMELQILYGQPHDGSFRLEPKEKGRRAAPAFSVQGFDPAYFFFTGALAAVFQIVVWFFLAQAKASGDAAQRMASRIIS